MYERARRGSLGVCVGQEGRARVAGLSLPLCPFVPPLSPPCIHTVVRQLCAMYGRAAVRAVCRRGVAMIAMKGSER